MLAIWHFVHVLTAAASIEWRGLKVRMEKFAKWWRHTFPNVAFLASNSIQISKNHWVYLRGIRRNRNTTFETSLLHTKVARPSSVEWGEQRDDRMKGHLKPASTSPPRPSQELASAVSEQVPWPGVIHCMFSFLYISESTDFMNLATDNQPITNQPHFLCLMGWLGHYADKTFTLFILLKRPRLCLGSQHFQQNRLVEPSVRWRASLCTCSLRLRAPTAEQDGSS